MNASTASGPRFVLIIDQFEELITGHPDRWEERADFFRQLNEALADVQNQAGWLAQFGTTKTAYVFEVL